MQRREKTLERTCFENIVVKFSLIIIKMVKFSKNNNIFLFNTLQKINKSQYHINKNKRVNSIMLWIMNWIKIIFYATQSKMKSYFKK